MIAAGVEDRAAFAALPFAFATGTAVAGAAAGRLPSGRACTASVSLCAWSGLCQRRFDTEGEEAVSVKPGLTRTYVCRSLIRACSGRGFGRPPPVRRVGLPAVPAGPCPLGRPGLCQSWFNRDRKPCQHKITVKNDFLGARERATWGFSNRQRFRK